MFIFIALNCKCLSWLKILQIINFSTFKVLKWPTIKLEVSVGTRISFTGFQFIVLASVKCCTPHSSKLLDCGALVVWGGLTMALGAEVSFSLPIDSLPIDSIFTK